MTKSQKIIKYFAIGIAFSLILGILSSIMFGLSAVSSFFNNKESNITENLKDINIDSSNVSILDVDISYANLIIKKGDTLKVETNNKYIATSNDGNKLIIKEKKHSWFNRSDESNLIIYIPDDFTFDGVSIDAGAGKIEINSLNTKILNFNLGAGKVSIDNLIVLGSAEIEGGAGELNILNASINNLDLDTGIGKSILVAELVGNNEIDVGVGELNVTLLGDKEKYRIVADKGIGNIKLQNKEIKSEKVYGNGINTVDISGGVGNININYE